MEEMFGESVVWHVLGDEKPLVTVAAIANQIRELLVPQLPNALRFFLIEPKPKPKINQIKKNLEIEDGREIERERVTANCWGSGQASLENFLTAMARRLLALVFWSLPL